MGYHLLTKKPGLTSHSTENQYYFNIMNKESFNLLNMAHFQVYYTHFLDDEKRQRLSRCDNTTRYYSTTIGNLKPGAVYEIDVAPIYEGKEGELNCQFGKCRQKTTYRIPGM